MMNKSINRIREWSTFWLLGLLLVALGIWAWLGSPSSAQAEFCRIQGGQEICLMDIKRSAKRFWEYRAIVRVDGKTRPWELYNCRDRVRVDADNWPLPFEKNGAGTLICNTLYHRDPTPSQLGSG
ncbi:MAG: hypothetical protein AAGA67_13790 [Cyanobacteria bacterium P01_F01_bin.153]